MTSPPRTSPCARTPTTGDNDEPLPPVHVATHEVKLRIDDLDTLSAYMEAARAVGFTDISDVSFTSREEITLREQARARAGPRPERRHPAWP